MYLFNARLNQIRVKRNMSQYRLAQLTGLSRQAIANLERSFADPKLSTIIRLARALEVSPRDLLPSRVPWTERVMGGGKGTRIRVPIGKRELTGPPGGPYRARNSQV